MKVEDIVQTNEAFIDPRGLIDKATNLVDQASRSGGNEQVQKIVKWVTPKINQMKTSKVSEFQGHEIAAYLNKLEQLLG